MKVIDISGEYQKGYVYFVRAGYFGPVKIGFTINFKKRLPHLQTGCPEILRPMVVIKTNRKTEEAYHNMFRDDNIHGEWFHPTERILKEIDYHLKHEPYGCQFSGNGGWYRDTKKGEK